MRSKRAAAISWFVFLIAVAAGSLLEVAPFSKRIFEKRMPLPAVVGQDGFTYHIQIPHSDWSAHVRPSRAAVLENGKPLPFANALHAEIKELGGGRYSFWHDHLLLSTTDNTSPATNGRSYEIVSPGSPPLWLRIALVTVGLLAMLGIALSWAGTTEALRSLAALARRSRRLRAAITACSILVSLTITVGIVEMVLRVERARATAITLPQPAVPTTWDAQLGSVFQPHTPFRYWSYVGTRRAFEIEHRANALGFLDGNAEGSGGVMLLGGRELEGLSVNQNENVAALLRERLGTVQSFGLSGLGLAGYLALWEKFSAHFAPRAVAIFVSRQTPRLSYPPFDGPHMGYSPSHPPRPQLGEDLALVAPEAAWQTFVSAPKQTERPLLALSTLLRLDRPVPWPQKQSGYRGAYIDAALLDPRFADDAEIKAAHDVARRALGQLVTKVSATGAKLLVVYVDPLPEQAVTVDGGDGILLRRLLESGTAETLPSVSLGNTATSKGLALHDLRYEAGDLRPVAHRLLADAIAELMPPASDRAPEQPSTESP